MKYTPTEWHTIPTGDGSPMRLFVARPETNAPAPCVMVFQEAFGVNAHICDVTSRIAALGYVAVAPELFHRTAPPGFVVDYKDIEIARPHFEAITEDNLETDIRATHAWLKADDQAESAHMAAVGFCLGGKAAFMANAVLPLKAAASYYGGGIAQALARAKDQHAPLLLFWGGKDARIGVEKQRAVADALKAAEKSFVEVEFSDAGHGFFCNARDAYHPKAASESWSLLTVFLRNGLGR